MSSFRANLYRLVLPPIPVGCARPRQGLNFLNFPSFGLPKRSASSAVIMALLLASCVGRREAPPVTLPPPSQSPQPPAIPPPPPPPVNAVEARVTAGPPLAFLPDRVAAAGALNAFRASCPVLAKRADQSGLTRPADWEPACRAAASATDPQSFFADVFETARVGDGKAFATGYYEPEIAGSRVRAPGYEVPVYRVPPDLVRGVFTDGKTGRGRTDETGAFLLYHDRAAIDAGALADRGLEIGWAADPIELFFLQIQGSGRLRLPDGGVMRIGYADQNGREYMAIGRLLKERGMLGPGQTSMQGIIGWLRANPEAGRAVMNENKSYIFFNELTGPGPLGSIGVPVTGRASVAVDPKFVPYGAPVLLTLDRTEANGLWVAQDTGGAIRGANRFDTFWGAGEEAKRIAGGMQGRGEALILLPKGTVARLRAESDARSQR